MISDQVWPPSDEVNWGDMSQATAIWVGLAGLIVGEYIAPPPPMPREAHWVGGAAHTGGMVPQMPPRKITAASTYTNLLLRIIRGSPGWHDTAASSSSPQPMVRGPPSSPRLLALLDHPR